MKLKSIHESIMIYGAPIKGCKVAESAHMITFFNTLRREYPEYAELVKATNGGETKPETLTYIKDVKTGYYRALAYNQPEDRLNVTN